LTCGGIAFDHLEGIALHGVAASLPETRGGDACAVIAIGILIAMDPVAPIALSSDGDAPAASRSKLRIGACERARARAAAVAHAALGGDARAAKAAVVWLASVDAIAKVAEPRRALGVVEARVPGGERARHGVASGGPSERKKISARRIGE